MADTLNADRLEPGERYRVHYQQGGVLLEIVAILEGVRGGVLLHLQTGFGSGMAYDVLATWVTAMWVTTADCHAPHTPIQEVRVY